MFSNESYQSGPPENTDMQSPENAPKPLERPQFTLEEMEALKSQLNVLGERRDALVFSMEHNPHLDDRKLYDEVTQKIIALQKMLGLRPQ